MPYARKKDSEHVEVVQAFTYYNWEVLDVSRAPLGVDLIVAHRIQKRVVLVEVKGKRGKLTKGQSEIFARWPGETAICRSLEDVARLTADGSGYKDHEHRMGPIEPGMPRRRRCLDCTFTIQADLP